MLSHGLSQPRTMRSTPSLSLYYSLSLRYKDKSWQEIAKAHPPVKSASGRKVNPNMGSIRRAYEASQSPG